jgi:tetratricopeptide (TPR) repeat protein
MRPARESAIVGVVLREDSHPGGKGAKLREKARGHAAEGHFSFAREAGRRAIARARRLARSAPDDVAAQRELAAGYRTLGCVCDLSEDWEGSRDAYSKALAVQRALVALGCGLSEPELGMIFVLFELGDAHFHTRNPDAARACWKEALARIADAPDRERIIDTEPYLATQLHEAIAHSYRHEGKVAPAVAAFRRALSAAEEVARRGIRDPQERREWGDTIGWAGVDACAYTVELLAEARELQKPKHQRMARSILRRARRLLTRARELEFLCDEDEEFGADRIREAEARCDEVAGGA